jgi:hypothetical protein
MEGSESAILNHSGAAGWVNTARPGRADFNQGYFAITSG